MPQRVSFEGFDWTGMVDRGEFGVDQAAQLEDMIRRCGMADELTVMRLEPKHSFLDAEYFLTSVDFKNRFEKQINDGKALLPRLEVQHESAPMFQVNAEGEDRLVAGGLSGETARKWTPEFAFSFMWFLNWFGEDEDASRPGNIFMVTSGGRTLATPHSWDEVWDFLPGVGPRPQVADPV